MSETAPLPTDLEEDMPIKLYGISKRLWPRKLYIKTKEFHPIAGSIFTGIWSIFWFVLAFTLNILFLGVIIISIAFVMAAIFGDSNFDPVFLGFDGSSKKKKREERY